MYDSNCNLVNNIAFTEREEAIFFQKVWDFLKEEIRSYTGGDHSSIRIEKAQDLLESVLFTISIVMEYGMTKREILEEDIQRIVEQGREILRKEQKETKIMWQLLCQDMPRIPNIYYVDTLQNLSVFFDRYDVNYKAHHIPCSIDYWPLFPVSEQTKGVKYIKQYLFQIQMENDFLQCFDQEQVIPLYEKYVPDYSETLFNLCEPILINAIGLVLVGGDIKVLNISEEERMKLMIFWKDKTIDDIGESINKAIVNLCEDIGMNTDLEISYFTNYSSGLSIRIYEALKNRDLSYVFITY